MSFAAGIVSRLWRYLDQLWMARSILSRAASIRAYMRGKNFTAYDVDEILRLAVERQNEIIGEALSRLVKDDPRLVSRIADYRKIIDFRTQLPTVTT